MPVSASKLVTLAQLQAQAERVKQELAKYTLASELGSLAKKSEISEADLSAALKSVIDGKMDAADSMTTEAINSAIATAIAKSAHARFEKVEKVPSNDEAQDNVLYLVMNAATGYYDIYAKVGEEVVRLDDTTVDLSNYATIEQLNAVSGGIGGTVYAGTKEDLSASDDSVIAAYFKAHTDVAVKKGDVFVVTTTVGNSTYEKSAYFYDGKAWVAMTGNVDADKVILRENITLAGDYAAVYQLMKDGVAVGAAINIPKDMVVKSGSVVTNPTGQPKGTYIKLVLANATNDTLYVDVGGLIEYVTSGSAAGDMVVIAIDEQTHKVTASITDGAITKAKLETEVQTALNKAHEHANKALLDTYDQTNADIKDAVSKKHSHANAAELDKIATGDKEKWDATSTKVEGIAEGATKVEASTTEGNIKINGVETAVVTIATDTEVTEMLTEVFGATA